MPRVRDSQGVRWSVRRRWLPWRPRRKMPDGWDLGGASFDGDDVVSMVINIVMLVVIIPTLVLALLVAVEFLLLLLLLPLWVLARSLFGAPWIIVVRRDGRILGEEAVRGWTASGRRIAQIAAEVGGR